MRKMGLDVGDKRTGVAVSDDLGLIVQGKKVWSL
jgi:RNase H-fold protein (predicted Holliday junction resolvase)